MTQKPSTCKHCNQSVLFILHRQIFVNGSSHFVWVCNGCQRIVPSEKGGIYIPHELIHSHLSDEQIEELPVLMLPVQNRCVVCGDRNCELHHWAPRAFFKDADEWPKDYLCKACHQRWHELVTPGLTF